MNKKRVFGLILLAISIISSFSNITLTGNVIGYSASSYFSLISVFSFILGIVLVLLAKVGGLERRILSKKELTHLTPKERAFRRKLVNLFDLQKPIEPKKIAYLLPQYDKIKKTGEYDSKTGERIFVGLREDKEEYFSVDLSTRHKLPKTHRIYAGLGVGYIPLPTHIDIKERIDTNNYEKISSEEI